MPDPDNRDDAPALTESGRRTGDRAARRRRAERRARLESRLRAGRAA